MSRLLVIEANDKGELSLAQSSDPFASWERIGISFWLHEQGTLDLEAEAEDEVDG